MIKVENLNYRYRKSNVDTIKDISFSVTKGEIFGFLGPSGAGKSTTQKVLTGLNRNYRGSVKVMGKEIKNIGREYYENIGVSFELPNLYTNFTARENLNFFSSFYSSKTKNIDDLLKIVGLLPDADKKVKDFSKGMKMRLNFIRALLNNPDVIFLDEPTSGLDPVNSDLIKRIISDLKNAGATIIITTHNMQVAAELCDRVAFIVDGEIKIIDSPKNLMFQYGKREVFIEYQREDKVLSEDFSLLNLGENSDFLNIIKNNEIKSIHTKDATLDDVFIKVTGRVLS